MNGCSTSAASAGTMLTTAKGACTTRITNVSEESAHRGAEQ